MAARALLPSLSWPRTGGQHAGNGSRREILPTGSPTLDTGHSSPCPPGWTPPPPQRGGGELRRSSWPSRLAWLLTLAAGVQRWAGGGEVMNARKGGPSLPAPCHFVRLQTSPILPPAPPAPILPRPFLCVGMDASSSPEMPCHQVSIRTHMDYNSIQVSPTAMRIWRGVSGPCLPAPTAHLPERWGGGCTELWLGRNGERL